MQPLHNWAILLLLIIKEKGKSVRTNSLDNMLLVHLDYISVSLSFCTKGMQSLHLTMHKNPFFYPFICSFLFSLNLSFSEFFSSVLKKQYPHACTFIMLSYHHIFIHVLVPVIVH